MRAVHSAIEPLVTGRAKSDTVLVGPLGGRLYHSNFRTKVDWVNLVGRLGWPALHFHDLRATAIVLWIRAGVPLSTVRALRSRQPDDHGPLCPAGSE